MIKLEFEYIDQLTDCLLSLIAQNVHLWLLLLALLRPNVEFVLRVPLLSLFRQLLGSVVGFVTGQLI